jgi:hypothetical protein
LPSRTTPAWRWTPPTRTTGSATWASTRRRSDESEQFYAAHRRHPGESAYPQLWKDLVAAWAPSGVPKHPTRLLDYSGNGNHGTLSNGANWTPGYKGWGMGFDGADDDVVGDSPGKNFPVGGESRTVACWIRSGGWINDKGLLHWGKVGPTPTGANYQLVAGTGGKILWGNGYGHGILTGNFNVADNKWHHVVGTYENGNGIIYIDGRIDATGTHTAATLLDDTWRWGRFQNQTGPWTGAMVECLVYRRKISDSEVKLLATGLSPFTTVKRIQRVRFGRRRFSFLSCSV